MSCLEIAAVAVSVATPTYMFLPKAVKKATGFNDSDYQFQ